MTKPGIEAVVTSYDALAAEYYDAGRHPTCANFREASLKLIERMLRVDTILRCCEVGAGDSILAEVAVERNGNADGLLITDASLAMLEYSRRWQTHGATLMVAQACGLPVRDHSLHLLVASLGDPYDGASFWREAARVLEPAGLCFLTTPSWEWAQRFRIGGHPNDLAQFELADGRTVAVPSLLRHPHDERKMIRRQGLVVIAEAEVALKTLSRPVSEKLQSLGREDPVVRGYLVTHAS